MSEINPIIRLRAKPSRVNAIKAKCAECMGCTADHLERGFRELIRAYTSQACPLHSFRPYQANLGAKPQKNRPLDCKGGAHADF